MLVGSTQHRARLPHLQYEPHPPFCQQPCPSCWVGTSSFFIRPRILIYGFETPLLKETFAVCSRCSLSPRLRTHHYHHGHHPPVVCPLSNLTRLSRTGELSPASVSWRHESFLLIHRPVFATPRRKGRCCRLICGQHPFIESHPRRAKLVVHAWTRQPLGSVPRLAHTHTPRNRGASPKAGHDVQSQYRTSLAKPDSMLSCLEDATLCSVGVVDISSWH